MDTPSILSLDEAEKSHQMTILFDDTDDPEFCGISLPRDCSGLLIPARLLKNAPLQERLQNHLHHRWLIRLRNSREIIVQQIKGNVRPSAVVG
jgi:hypothetical protein